jgi:general secretion pathway protein B
MSYILEALKKAQAERQLGSAPTIHASPLAHPAPIATGASRKPLLIGLGAGALVVAVAAVVAWRHQDVAPASPPVVVAASAPAVVAEPAPLPAPAVVRQPTPRSAPAAIPAPAPRAAPADIPEPASRSAPVPPAKTAVAKPAPRPLPESPQPEAEPAVYESVRGLQALPEVIQREVPKVAVGGYIYSQNPADRLLLVDKTLRREGEEVAPGLVLERLLPKAAVMNYRGYRYRVPY